MQTNKTILWNVITDYIDFKINMITGKLGWKLIGRITSIGTVYDCDFTKYNELFFVNSTSASSTRYHIHIITACLTDNKQVFVSYVAYQNSHSFSMEIDIRKTSANLLVFGGFSSGQLNDIINIYAR